MTNQQGLQPQADLVVTPFHKILKKKAYVFWKGPSGTGAGEGRWRKPRNFHYIANKNPHR